MMRQTKLFSLIGGAMCCCSLIVVTHAFCGPRQQPMMMSLRRKLIQQQQQQQQQQRQQSPPTQLSMNFFKELLGGAFENDPTISKEDRVKGQLEGPNSKSQEERRREQVVLTEVQRAWRERQAGSPVVVPDRLVGTVWSIDLYLAGVPNKDPSNDLFASRTNISTRDRQSNLDLPAEPTVSSLMVEFLENRQCRVGASPLTTGRVLGEWRVSDDGATVRFSMDTLGYSRTVQTTGSIANVFWTDEPEKSVQTSTSYSIPPGMIYADVPIGYGTQPGTVQAQSDGILRVEQRMGLLGAASKLVPCGKFTATQQFSSSSSSSPNENNGRAI